MCLTVFPYTTRRECSLGCLWVRQTSDMGGIHDTVADEVKIRVVPPTRVMW